MTEKKEKKEKKKKLAAENFKLTLGAPMDWLAMG
jgi:hypothetical protein